MAHVKASGSKASQGANVVGKRRGLKVAAGQAVSAGQVLVRQLGTKYYPGANTKRARNDDIIATASGVVRFSRIKRPRGMRVLVHVDVQG